MADKVVPFNRERKKDNIEILLSINKEVSEIDDPAARKEIRETLRKVAARLFSSSPSISG